MRSVRAVVEYTGLNMLEALELPCDMFMLCYKNRVIEILQQTEQGREYLEDCERLRQTKMDIDGVRRLMKTMGG